MSTITSKRGDTARKIKDVLKYNGTPINLAGATVVLVLRPINDISGTLYSVSPFRRDAIITDPLGGAVEYQPISADVTAATQFLIEWEVTFPDGTVVTVPDGAFHTWEILTDLG